MENDEFSSNVKILWNMWRMMSFQSLNSGDLNTILHQQFSSYIGDKPLPRCRMQSGATGPKWINSLSPGTFERNLKEIIFMLILVINGRGISCEIALRWISLDFIDDQSTLVQVMAWCRQATSHYLSQCGPRSLSPYGVIRPQWVNLLEIWMNF